MVIQALLVSASQRVGDRDTAWVSMAKLQLSLPGIPWLIIKSQAQLGSAMQSRMRFIDWSDAKFDECGLNMDVSFQSRHGSVVTISY